jgi:hypothetical protein
MGNAKRIFVYMGGFVIGMMLVSMILSRRSAKEASQVDPWLEHNQNMIQAGAKPLPDGVPDSIRAGLVINFGELPSAEAPEQAVWMVTFEESYPFVRVVQDLSIGAFSYMAADQISIKVADGVDLAELKPMLDELGLRVRMFNRKEDLMIVGVLSTALDAIPATIEAVQPWSELFSSVEPDYIRFQPKKPGQ